MSDKGLQLDITLPRCDVGELRFLQEWSATRAKTFPHFAQFVCTLATDECARRLNPGDEASMIELPELSGEQWADYLIGAYTLSELPLTANVAVFVDDLHRKIVCSVSGFLEALCCEVVG